MIEFTTGKNVALECRLLGRLLARFLILAWCTSCDGVMEIKPTRLQEPVYRFEVSRVVAKPDMLKHSNGRNLIVRAFQLRIVYEIDCDPLLQTQAKEPPRCCEWVM
jgi:hypothetical protein